MALVLKYDLSQAKEGGGNFNRVHAKEGEYRFTIADISAGESKNGQEQLIVTIGVKAVPGARYPYYVPLNGDNAWKMRNFLQALGVPTDKPVAKFDFHKAVGKDVGGVLKDSEWEGRIQSEVSTVFHVSQLLEFDGTGSVVSSEAPTENGNPPPADDDDEEIDLEEL